MAWTSFTIESYEIYCVAHNTEGYTGVYGFIRLYWESRYRASLFFYRDTVTTISPNTSQGSGGNTFHYARFGQSQMRECVDLLRNEKPVYFKWDETTKAAMISSGSEPIGETELP